MSFMPKRTKFRKQQKGQHAGLSKGGNFIEFGDFGMQTLDRGRITAQQMEACRVAINRYFKRRGKVWIRIFPDKPITKHPAESRMGSGKGDVVGYVAVVKPGNIIFEMGSVTLEVASEAMRLAAHKLPIKTKLFTKEGALQ